MSKPYAISCHPWKIQNGRIKDSKGNILAQVRYSANRLAPGNISAMCAAPLMLEALKDAQKQMVRWSGFMEWQDSDTETMAKIGAAIAAATGETK